MRSATLLLLLAAALGSAQSVNTTYLTGLVNALNGAGYTSLTSSLTSLASDSSAQGLLSQLSGGPKTVFAPTNDAVGANSSPLNASSISYHIISGTANESNIAFDPYKSPFRTFLNDSQLVSLEGNSSQVLVLQKTNSSQILVCNQPVNPTTASNPTRYENLLIYGINSVLTIPGSITTLLGTPNFTGLNGIAGSGLAPTLENAHGFTLFAPDNNAISTAQSSLAGANASVVTTVLGNHIINGTTVYSSSFGSGSATSAAGDKLSYISNSTGHYVTSGNVTARVTQSDVLLKNGVAHIIDRVLLNTNSNPSAASSAFQSATSAAGTAAGQPTGTGPVATNAGGHNGAVAIGTNSWSVVAAALGVAAGAVLVL